MRFRDPVGCLISILIQSAVVASDVPLGTARPNIVLIHADNK